MAVLQEVLPVNVNSCVANYKPLADYIIIRGPPSVIQFSSEGDCVQLHADPIQPCGGGIIARD